MPFPTVNLNLGYPKKGGLLPFINWQPKLAQIIPSTSTHTRASNNCLSLTTTKGTSFFYQPLFSDEILFNGLRREFNRILASDYDDFTNWSVFGAPTVTSDTITFNSDGDGVFEFASAFNPGGTINGRTAWMVLEATGNGTATLNIADGIGADLATQQITLTSTPTLFAVKQDFAVSNRNDIVFRIRRLAGDTATTLVRTSEGVAVTADEFGSDRPPSIFSPSQTFNANQPGVVVYSTSNESLINPDGTVAVNPGIPLSSIRPNPGLVGPAVPNDLAIVNGVPNVSFASPVTGPTTTIFVRIGGDDANDGLSEGQALRTVDKAFEIIHTTGASNDDFRIDIGPGRWFSDQVYPTATGAPGNFPNLRDIEIVGTGTRPQLVNANDPTGVTWNDEGDGTYTSTITDCFLATDFATIDAFGLPTALTEVADLPALLAAPEGFFVIGDVIRVKPIRAGTPDNDLLVFFETTDTINIFRNSEVYFNNISWFGWNLRFNAGFQAFDYKVVLDDCYFGYTPNNISTINALAVPVGITQDTRTINVVIGYSGGDGFNYTTDPANPGDGFNLEYLTTVYKSGRETGALQNQASSGHSGSQVMRVASVFRDSSGPGIADVADGTRAWNYNCQFLNNGTYDVDTLFGWYDTIDFAASSTTQSFAPAGSNVYLLDSVTNIQGVGQVTGVFSGTEPTGWMWAPEATNICIESNDYNTSWNLDGLLPPVNNSVGDLGLVQHRLDAGVANSGHRMFIIPAGLSPGSGYCYVRQVSGNTGRYMTFRRGGNAVQHFACADMQQGIITETGIGTVAAFIRPVANGWYKVSMRTADTSPVLQVSISDTPTPGTATPIFTGANEQIDICFVQGENTEYTTPPMITAGAEETRIAASLTDQDWPEESSAIIDLTIPEDNPATGPGINMLGFGSAAANVFVVQSPDTVVLNNNDIAASVTASTPYEDERHQFGMSLKVNEGIVVDDEDNDDTDVAGTPQQGTIYMGSNSLLKGAPAIYSSIRIYDKTQTIAELS